MYCFALAHALTVCYSGVDSTLLLRSLGQNCFTLSCFGVLAGGQSGADCGYMFCVGVCRCHPKSVGESFLDKETIVVA
jgi:hypothetical protein